jgi:hypothetical protein
MELKVIQYPADHLQFPGGGAGRAHKPLPGTGLHPQRQRAEVQLLRRSLAATLRPCGTGARPAAPSGRLTSSPDPQGRTASPSRSTGASGMSSSMPSCSPRLQRLNSSPIAGAGSKIYIQVALVPPGAYAPRVSSTKSCRMTTASWSYQHWTNKRGHVSESRQERHRCCVA